MHFASISEFFGMGGYSFYVWLAFGITLFSMGWLVADAMLTRRKLLAEINKRAERERRMEKAKKRENTL